MIEYKNDPYGKDHAIWFPETGRPKVIMWLERSANTLSPPDPELIKLLDDLKEPT